MSVLVNDIHSELNETAVREVVGVRSIDDVQEAVRRAGAEHLPVAIAAGRHAMGGQQFCSDALLLDMRGLDGVVSLDAGSGTIVVQAGIQWPDLLAFLRQQPGDGGQWAFRQKQTGADRLSIGGALAANAHGRDLVFPPFASDVESFIHIDPSGELVVCSREENAELFALVASGYGLFGCVVEVTMRLVPLRTVERVVEVREIEDLSGLFASRIADGFEYGDPVRDRPGERRLPAPRRLLVPPPDRARGASSGRAVRPHMRRLARASRPSAHGQEPRLRAIR